MTKQDLLNLGITLVTTDARVFKGEYEYKPGLTKKGYRRVHIGKKEYKLHQLVWVWNVGEEEKNDYN